MTSRKSRTFNQDAFNDDTTAFEEELTSGQRADQEAARKFADRNLKHQREVAAQKVRKLEDRYREAESAVVAARKEAADLE